ncbi:MAG: PAS domain-containing protein, partial [Desulfuromonadales bacterium]|nr:PAS domain-containing protein [Desulfuromonadales bacterium]NIS44304.1 PAS domain-containing protein [Desulfuromonadales bacterium]
FQREKVLDVYNEILVSRQPAQAEVFFPGSQRYLLISVFLLGDKHFATLTKDITDRKKAEEERERLFAELDATINAIADAVVIYTPDGRIARMNPAAQDLLGYTPE